MAAEKAALRRRLLAARARLSPDQRAAAARALRDAVLEMPQVQMAGTIAAYYSLSSEPDTHGLVYALWKRGGYVLLPLLRPDADLDWASYEGPDSLRPGPRGLAEPSEPPRGMDAVTRADLVLVPALAVDRSGVRPQQRKQHVAAALPQRVDQAAGVRLGADRHISGHRPRHLGLRQRQHRIPQRTARGGPLRIPYLGTPC